jgi:hypothetical protein
VVLQSEYGAVDCFKVLSGWIRSEGCFLLIPVEWQSDSRSEVEFKIKYIIPTSNFRNERIHEEIVRAGSPRQD